MRPIRVGILVCALLGLLCVSSTALATTDGTFRFGELEDHGAGAIAALWAGDEAFNYGWKLPPGCPLPTKGTIRPLIIVFQTNPDPTGADYANANGRMLEVEKVVEGIAGPPAIKSRAYPFESVNAFYRRSSSSQMRFVCDSSDVVTIPIAYPPIYPSFLDPTGHLRLITQVYVAMAQATAAVEARGYDLSRYDSNGDHAIDCPIFLWSGDYVTSPGGPMWAQALPFSAFMDAWFGKNNDYRLMSFVWAPEFRTYDPFAPRLGADLLCHEIGHLCGQSDYYDYTDGSPSPDDHKPVGGGTHGFEMMDANGCDFSAYTKWTFGWREPLAKIGANTEGRYIFPSAAEAEWSAKDAESFYLVTTSAQAESALPAYPYSEAWSGSRPRDYYLVEWRGMRRANDSRYFGTERQADDAPFYLPNEATTTGGLAVWHVNPLTTGIPVASDHIGEGYQFWAFLDRFDWYSPITHELLIPGFAYNNTAGGQALFGQELFFGPDAFLRFMKKPGTERQNRVWSTDLLSSADQRFLSADYGQLRLVLPAGLYEPGIAIQGVEPSINSGDASWAMSDGSAWISTLGPDTTQPSLSISLDGLHGDNDWFRSAVTVNIDALDQKGDTDTVVSGVDRVWAGEQLDKLELLKRAPLNAAPNTVYHVTASAPVYREGARDYYVACRDEAISQGKRVTRTLRIKIDTVAPSISVVAPTAGAVYVKNQRVLAQYTVTDTTSGTDPSLWTASAQTLAPIDTSSLGSKVFTIQARDVAGNVSSTDVAYSVPYQSSGIQRPVTPDSVFKLGTSIPFKFSITNANGEGVVGLKPRLSFVKISNSITGRTIVPASNIAPTEGDVFADKGRGDYELVRRTTGLTQGTWRATVDLGGGAKLEALFSLK